MDRVDSGRAAESREDFAEAASLCREIEDAYKNKEMKWENVRGLSK